MCHFTFTSKVSGNMIRFVSCKGNQSNIRCQWDLKIVADKKRHIDLTLDMPI